MPPHSGADHNYAHNKKAQSLVLVKKMGSVFFAFIYKFLHYYRSMWDSKLDLLKKMMELFGYH